MNRSTEPMQATKWLKVQLLAEASEIEALFTSLGDFDIFISGSVTAKGEGKISHEQFIKTYTHYIQELQKGKIPAERDYRLFFSTIFTKDPEALFVVPLGSCKQLLRVSKPVVQLQPHSLDYSMHDKKFRPMVFGLESVLWGIQFSYPQLFQDPVTKEPLNVDESDLFPNTELFKSLQRWIRHNTIPTPFLVEGKKINVPMRLGKRCLSWINFHPQLSLKNIKVIGS